MTSSHYRRGADRERRIRQKLEADGYFCIRSAGSHTPVDLVCFKEHRSLAKFHDDQQGNWIEIRGAEILFCQCKGSRGMTRAQKTALVELAHRYGARPVLAGPRGRFEYLDEDEAA